MSVADLYNEVSKRYDDIVEATNYIGPEYLSNELPENITAKLILDLGCANGRLGGILRKSYPLANIIGYDISPEMIKLAKKSGVYDSVAVTDLNNSLDSIKTGAVSIIVGFGFCEFLNHPKTLLLNLHSLLMPNATLLLSFQEYWPHSPKLAPRTTRSGSVTHNAYSISEIADMFIKTGFVIKKIESVTGYTSSSGFACPYIFVNAIKA